MQLLFALDELFKSLLLSLNDKKLIFESFSIASRSLSILKKKKIGHRFLKIGIRTKEIHLIFFSFSFTFLAFSYLQNAFNAFSALS